MRWADEHLVHAFCVKNVRLAFLGGSEPSSRMLLVEIALSGGLGAVGTSSISL